MIHNTLADLEARPRKHQSSQRLVDPTRLVSSVHPFPSTTTMASLIGDRQW